MKNILLAAALLFVVNAHADIEHVPSTEGKATEQEVSKSRSCFQELESQGCGDPGEDVVHFRSCLNNVFSTLNTDCKKIMTNLYGGK